MDLTIYPSTLSGKIQAIPSKSQAHRLLICAAFSDKETILECPQTNEDIEATVCCLNALGANIVRKNDSYQITPVIDLPENTTMDCGESGSTLRFLLPIVCALGIAATIQMHGRLPYRPLSPLWEELEHMGAILTRPTENTIQTAGRLRSGNYRVSGNVSSQYISGLLFATALLEGQSKIEITGKLESKPYIDMTQDALNTFGVDSKNFKVKGCRPFHSPGKLKIEGDWSNAAFFFTANALGCNVDISNLSSDSSQGDRAVAQILSNYKTIQSISAADIPDLVPILSVFWGAKNGVEFTDIARLRLKESDRVASVCNMMNKLGARANATENTLTITAGTYHGCTIDSAGDHRIAMAAAIAATLADGPVTILGAECVAKSYPGFWEDYKNLGGHYE